MPPYSALATALLTAALALPACDTDDDGAAPRYVPTEADRARCAHIDREAALGERLYNTCLVNPWPTELPEVEVGGEPVLAAWINDTLAFVADDPRETARFNIKISSDPQTERTSLIGRRATFSKIDPAYFSLIIRINLDGSLVTTGSLSRLWVTDHPLAGEYIADTTHSHIDFNITDGYAHGTFDLTLFEETTGQELTLTDGRFHRYFGQ